MRKYFITGALVLVPLAITAWVLNFVISTLDQSLVLVPSEWQPRTYIPGLGAIITLAIVFLTGVLTALGLKWALKGLPRNPIGSGYIMKGPQEKN